MSKENNKNEIWKNLTNFVHNIDGIHKSLFSIVLMSTIYKKESQKVEKFINEKGKKIKKGKLVLKFNLDVDDQVVYESLNDELEKSKVAMTVLPRSLFISAVSYFDMFLINMLKVVYAKNPARLSDKKDIVYGEIKNLKTVKEITDHLIEIEIDSILRGGRKSSLLWFKDNLNIDIDKYFKDELTTFVEITERRNLFTHANGIVNKTYIEKCLTSGIPLTKLPKVGLELTVGGDYFISSMETLQEIATKLTYLVHAKLYSSKEEIDNLNICYNNDICVKLIKEKKLVSAHKLTSFVTDNFKLQSSEEMYKMLIINKALAKKLDNNNKEAFKIIEKVDWTAVGDEFRLAVCILKDNNDGALKIIKKIGKDTFLKKAYESDPLFLSLRTRQDFKDLFEKIYKEKFRTKEEKIIESTSFLKKFQFSLQESKDKEKGF